MENHHNSWNLSPFSGEKLSGISRQPRSFVVCTERQRTAKTCSFCMSCLEFSPTPRSFKVRLQCHNTSYIIYISSKYHIYIYTYTYTYTYTYHLRYHLNIIYSYIYTYISPIFFREKLHLSGWIWPQWPSWRYQKHCCGFQPGRFNGRCDNDYMTYMTYMTHR